MKTTIAAIMAVCVMMAQTGMLLAVDSVAVPEKCTKCPCEIEKPSCCVKKAGSKESPDTPALPASEQRVLQPVAFDLPIHGVVSIPAVTPDKTASRALPASSLPSVPLFLRNRAILI